MFTDSPLPFTDELKALSLTSYTFVSRSKTQNNMKKVILLLALLSIGFFVEAKLASKKQADVKSPAPIEIPCH